MPQAAFGDLQGLLGVEDLERITREADAERLAANTAGQDGQQRAAIVAGELIGRALRDRIDPGGAQARARERASQVDNAIATAEAESRNAEFTGPTAGLQRRIAVLDTTIRELGGQGHEVKTLIARRNQLLDQLARDEFEFGLAQNAEDREQAEFEQSTRRNVLEEQQLRLVNQARERQAEFGNSQDILVMRGPDGKRAQIRADSPQFQEYLNQGYTALGTLEQLNLLALQRAKMTAEERQAADKPKKSFNVADTKTIDAINKMVPNLARAEEMLGGIPGSDAEVDTGILSDVFGLRTFVFRNFDVPFVEQMFTDNPEAVREMVNIAGTMRLAWQDILAGNPSDKENALAQNITISPDKSNETNLQLIDMQRQAVRLTARRLYAQALDTGQSINTLVPMLQALGMNPGDPSLGGWNAEDHDRAIDALNEQVDRLNAREEPAPEGALFSDDRGVIR